LTAILKEIDNLVPINIEDEMKKSYLDYAMSVIVSRAIPDAKDGLKPVHRRILFAMYEAGIDFNKAYKKSARIVGDVMGKYHPHGDAAIYDSLVRMAQDFSLRLTLIDGQGNFGSMDGDSPAAMRYTESRLEKAAHELLSDIDKDTVDFQDNYDGSEREPKVLPAKFPNLLVNGAGGIAVGMATNIPTHNLGEVIDAACAFVDNPLISCEELLNYVPAPDFPTGGTILGRSGSRAAMLTGRGSVIMRGRTNIEQNKNGREAIIITEIPYQVNKAKLIERIAELLHEKRIEGISDLRDESDKSGVRVVIELKKDAYSDVIVNQLYSYTPLQTSFGVNMLALDNGQPKLMNLRDIIECFINFREEVITRRSNFLLSKSRDKAHVLVGLYIAVCNIDDVINLIRSSQDPVEAKEKLLAKSWPAQEVRSLIELVGDMQNEITDGYCKFTEVQAKAILEMRLQRLTGLEREKLSGELEQLSIEIKDFLEILSSRARLMSDLKQELIAVKEEFATPRKTEIEESEFEQDIESLIPKEDMVVTVTLGGYIKRVPLSTYRAQRRGGKGRSGMSLRDEDVTTNLFIADTHTPILFFSNFGKVYKLKLYKIPVASAQAKGRALINLLPLAEGEIITSLSPLNLDGKSWDDLNIVFATYKGNIRRNRLSDFESIQSNGKIAMKLEDGDSLIGVAICDDQDHIFLASKSGNGLRFPVESVRVFKGRMSDGVRGMRLDGSDCLVSMSILKAGEQSTEIRDNYLRIPLETRAQIKTATTIEEVSELLKGIESSLSIEKIWDMAKIEQFILSVTENGFGKRSSAYEYRITNRGGSGVVNIITSERNGCVVASMPITDDEQLVMITDKGTLIRCLVTDVRIIGRNTQGVVLFKTSGDEKIMSTAKVPVSDDEQEDLECDIIEQAE
jgi:DNA gyrase subunit A